MRKLSWAAGCAFALSGSAAAIAHSPEHGDTAPPRLLVLIVVDQMSDDLLDRYGKHLRGGFGRLLDEGLRFSNAVVDHAPTNSLPGHLSAATGTHPRRHGIVDNEWVEIRLGKPVTITGFHNPACGLGEVPRPRDAATAQQAGIGPGLFESATIVEWVIAANPNARFASVGTGEGVSALHAGKAKGPVLWYDTVAGAYVTSGCYAPAVPDWTAELNARLDSDFMSKNWTLAAPESMARLADNDRLAHENGGSANVFPHRHPQRTEQRRQWFYWTPFVDAATLELAISAVKGERLGEDDVTDILTVGLSALDHVGHRFGPTSLEQADTLFRMDQQLGDFFQYLDQRVGRDRWAVALTADHGASPAPEVAAREGIGTAKRIGKRDAAAAIEAVFTAAGEYSDPAVRTAAAAEAAARLDFVARVIIAASLKDRSRDPDAIIRLYANSYRDNRVSTHPLYADSQGRSVAEFGLIVVPHPYAVVDWATSIHGSPYPYDREVEMLFYGPQVEAGISDAQARTIDVAPTLSAMAGVAPLQPVDGRILFNVPLLRQGRGK